MYHNTEFSYIFNLLKSAARDVPDFYPDWVRNYSHLNRYDSLRQIKKEIPVKDYREQVPSITNTSEYIHSKILEDIITFKYDLASLEAYRLTLVSEDFQTMQLRSPQAS